MTIENSSVQRYFIKIKEKFSSGLGRHTNMVFVIDVSMFKSALTVND